MQNYLNLKIKVKSYLSACEARFAPDRAAKQKLFAHAVKSLRIAFFLLLAAFETQRFLAVTANALLPLPVVVSTARFLFVVFFLRFQRLLVIILFFGLQEVENKLSLLGQKLLKSPVALAIIFLGVYSATIHIIVPDTVEVIIRLYLWSNLPPHVTAWQHLMEYMTANPYFLEVKSGFQPHEVTTLRSGEIRVSHVLPSDPFSLEFNSGSQLYKITKLPSGEIRISYVSSSNP